VPDALDYEVSKSGDVYSFKTEQFLTLSDSATGYKTVRIDGKNRYVHELVLTTFKGKRPKGMEARHLDGDKLNCYEDNLEWGTPSQNVQDQVRHGTHYLLNKGELHPSTKLLDSEVVTIRAMASEGWSQTEIANMFGVSQRHIGMIIKGERR
jgi:hypothetical protein